MKREKVIELALKSDGMFLEQGTPGVTAVHKLWEFWPDGLQEFARLVELETLEMAAKKCDDIAYMMGGSVGAMDCALSIRSLKNHPRNKPA